LIFVFVFGPIKHHFLYVDGAYGLEQFIQYH